MYKKFFRYVLNSVSAMIGISIYVLADTFFISVYAGADGLAVLNLILPVYGLVYGIGAMVGIGYATRFGIKKAMGENTSPYFFQSVSFSVLLSIPFILAGILAPDIILKLLGANQTLINLGTSYFRVALIGAPFFMTNYSFTGFIRNDNDPGRAMVGALAGCGFNIVFDYIFMFHTPLGFTGAALATAMSPIVTMSICSIHFKNKNNKICIQVKALDVSLFKKCCPLGVSAFVGEVTSAVITIVFNILLLRMVGNLGVAAYGVVANYSIVVMAILNGIAQGVQPLISEAYGQSNYNDQKILLKYAVILTGLIEICLVVIDWLFTSNLVSLFNSEGNIKMASYAYDGMRLYFLGFIFAGINIVLIAYYSAIAKKKIAMLGSALRGAVLIVIFALIMSFVIGINGIWLSFLASEMVTFFILAFKSPLLVK